MNIAYIVINDLSEIDFDDLYERCRADIDAHWPASSTLTSEERKTNMLAVIRSGINNEWPGLNIRNLNDRHIMSKTINLDTGKEMAFLSGYILSDNVTFDGRHSLTAPDENGSRSWLYENLSARDTFLRSLGVSKALFRNIPTDSIMHRIIRRRALESGGFEILEDADSSQLGSNFRNILVQYNI